MAPAARVRLTDRRRASADLHRTDSPVIHQERVPLQEAGAEQSYGESSLQDLDTQHTIDPIHFAPVGPRDTGRAVREGGDTDAVAQQTNCLDDTERNGQR